MEKCLIPRSNILDTEHCSSKNAPLEIHQMQCFVAITHNNHLLNECVECIWNIADGLHMKGLRWNLESAHFRAQSMGSLFH